MHLGLIGGIGSAATQFYYRHLAAASKAAGTPYRMTIDHADNAGLVANFFADRRAEQAEVFAGHLSALQAAGAEIGAVTALAGHFCIEETIAASPIPILNAVDAIRDAMAERGLKTVGLLGAGRVMDTGLWGALDTLTLITPSDTKTTGHAYIDMAQRGSCTEAERAYFFDQGAALMDRGAEAVFLAGTDLFLAFEDQDPGYPVIDGGLLHIAALARLAET